MNCPFNWTIYKLSNRKDNMGLTLFFHYFYTQLHSWLTGLILFLTGGWSLIRMLLIFILWRRSILCSLFWSSHVLEILRSDHLFFWNILSSKLTSQDSSPYIWLVWRQAVSSEAQRSGYIYRRTEIMLFHYEPKRRPLKVKTNKGDFKIAFFIFLQSNVAQWHDCIALWGAIF